MSQYGADMNEEPLSSSPRLMHFWPFCVLEVGNVANEELEEDVLLPQNGGAKKKRKGFLVKWPDAVKRER